MALGFMFKQAKYTLLGLTGFALLSTLNFSVAQEANNPLLNPNAPITLLSKPQANNLTAPTAEEIIIKEQGDVCQDPGDRQTGCVLIKNDEDGLEKWFFKQGQVYLVERYDVNFYLMTRTLYHADQFKEVEYYDGNGFLMQRVMTKGNQLNGKNQFYFKGNLVLDVDYAQNKVVAAHCYTTNHKFSLAELAILTPKQIPTCPLEADKK